MSGPDPQGATGRGITWYDILDVLPDASADMIQQAYDAKASLLRPPLPPAKVHRASALTVQVWHPPASAGQWPV